VTYVGVDGCRSGWVLVALTETGDCTVRVETAFEAVWTGWRHACCILVDIPIGLRDAGPEERLCDIEARRLLGRPRGSSVFPVPCRSALCAPDYCEACRINLRQTGRKLTQQTWNIAKKIREMDEFLRRTEPARNAVFEIHPEVLFWALNSARSLKHNKRSSAGFQERLRILRRFLPDSRRMVDAALKRFRRSEVGWDDILDALVGALCGCLSKGRLPSLPAEPERDGFGLPMQICYYRP